MFPACPNSDHLRKLLASTFSYNARAVIAHTLYTHGQIRTNNGPYDDRQRSTEITWLADQFVESMGGADVYEEFTASLGL